MVLNPSPKIFMIGVEKYVAIQKTILVHLRQSVLKFHISAFILKEYI